MAAFLDACRFTPSAGGTTDWTVSAAVQGYMTPASAGAVNGTKYKYRAESADLTQWEIGEGVYTVAGTVLARTTILFSTNSNAKVTFSAAPQVAVVAIKEDLLSVEEANAFTTAQQDQARSNINANRAITTITNTLGADVTMNTNAFFDGPSCAQGSTGTWLAFGVVNIQDTSAAASMVCKLHDGTNTVASSLGITAGANLTLCVSLSGIFTSPPGNIRISCADANGTPAGKIKFNASGVGKDSTLTVVRIA